MIYFVHNNYFSHKNIILISFNKSYGFTIESVPKPDP